MKPSPTISLEILLGACERRLGRDAPVARQLRLLLADRSRDAFERARASFDALPGALRAELAGEAYRLASGMRRAAIVRVAQKYIDPAHLAIVIVGDAKAIEAPLAATKIAPIVHLDSDGNPVGDTKQD